METKDVTAETPHEREQLGALGEMPDLLKHRFKWPVHPRIDQGEGKLYVHEAAPLPRQPACQRVLHVPCDAFQVAAETEDCYIVMVRAVVPKASVPDATPGTRVIVDNPTPPQLPCVSMPTVNLYLGQPE